MTEAEVDRLALRVAKVVRKSMLELLEIGADDAVLEAMVETFEEQFEHAFRAELFSD